jgi:hypothetical protein
VCKWKFVLTDIPINKSERRVNKTGEMYRTGVECGMGTVDKGANDADDRAANELQM